MKALRNLKDLKTTIPGLLLFLSGLPGSDLAQKLIAIYPTAALYILGVAKVAGGLALIFGVQAAATHLDSHKENHE